MYTATLGSTAKSAQGRGNVALARIPDRPDTTPNERHAEQNNHLRKRRQAHQSKLYIIAPCETNRLDAGGRSIDPPHAEQWLKFNPTLKNKPSLTVRTPPPIKTGSSLDLGEKTR
jgi:hypothetical protein